MARLADRVGVSRQTVYNEVGTKPGLAEAMILHELDRFLGGGRPRRSTRTPTTWSPRSAAAVARRARAGPGQPLLHAVVSATHGADTELLPLLTTHARVAARGRQGGGRRAGRAVRRRRSTPTHLDAAIDMVVRVVLSHVMQPSGPPERDRRRHRLDRRPGAARARVSLALASSVS